MKVKLELTRENNNIFSFFNRITEKVNPTNLTKQNRKEKAQNLTSEMKENEICV